MRDSYVPEVAPLPLSYPPPVPLSVTNPPLPTSIASPRQQSMLLSRRFRRRFRRRSALGILCPCPPLCIFRTLICLVERPIVLPAQLWIVEHISRLTDPLKSLRRFLGVAKVLVRMRRER